MPYKQRALALAAVGVKMFSTAEKALFWVVKDTSRKGTLGSRP
jgi:hypothetical protein